MSCFIPYKNNSPPCKAAKGRRSITWPGEMYEQQDCGDEGGRALRTDGGDLREKEGQVRRPGSK